MHGSAHGGLATNLGWASGDAKAQQSAEAIKEAEAKLKNDGRELRSTKENVHTSPGGEAAWKAPGKAS